MQKPKPQHVPVTLQSLNKKLAVEIKRLIREKEDGVVKHVATKASLNGISRLTFKNKEGKEVTLSYRYDNSGALRFAREKQFAILPTEEKKIVAGNVGRSSKDVNYIP